MVVQLRDWKPWNNNFTFNFIICVYLDDEMEDKGAATCLRGSESSFVEWILSFYLRVGSRDQPHIIYTLTHK